MPSTSGPPSLARDTFQRLADYCKQRDWAGYDPYDALNSALFAHTPLARSRYARIAFTQAMKRLPVNIRPLLGVRAVQNPKALGLFLTAFVRLSRHDSREETRTIADALIDRLKASRSADEPRWVWGYSFPWQTRTKLVARGTPNIVCTTFAGNALVDAFENGFDGQCLDMAVSAAEYILDTLYWTDGATAAFSYPLPTIKVPVHNANFLGAAYLCRIAKHTGDARFKEAALTAARYSASKQRPDGSWAYGEASTQEWIDNFHTGYNLCALRSVGVDSGSLEFEPHVRRGFDFYRTQFFLEDGTPKYFHNRTYPVDIHSVAQSIITLLALYDLAPETINTAFAVYEWAMRHMWDDRGYFYYQVRPHLTNRISYMRWSQAWMLVALATMFEHVG
jgi:hypothetical protein